LIRLATLRAKMDVGQEQRPNTLDGICSVKHQQF
jgi:hypothetical protein